MMPRLSTLTLTLAALIGPIYGLTTVPKADSSAKACQLLQAAFPQLVAFPSSEQYEVDIDHWAVTSTQIATCSIEPGNSDDVSEILKVIGRSDVMAPFAVKGGGHAVNLGHSSTTGVQISMARFDGLEYDAESGTVTIGTGLTWDEVYQWLEPLNVMVVGGRLVGIGVAGLSLGGGYSWKTNQYGLTIDTIVSHNVVLPSGQEVTASNSSHPDLFFALKGGLNNFGIVTNISFEVHPQTLVYGGVITYTQNETDAVNLAVSSFSSQNTDPKAQILAEYTSFAGQFSTSINLFYDGPDVPAGIFDTFLSIPSLTSDVKKRTFVDFVAASSTAIDDVGVIGYAQDTVPLTDYPKELLDTMVQEVISVEERLTAASNGSGVAVSTSSEPFLNLFSNSRGGAYPHSPSRPVTPGASDILYQINPNWTQNEHSAFHDLVVSSIKDFSRNIQAEAVAQGVSHWNDLLYPNYALDGTPIELMYGSNVPKLRKIAAKYDPNGVMKLTGGPHF